MSPSFQFFNNGTIFSQFFSGGGGVYEDTGCNSEDLPETMNDRGSGDRGSGISVLVARQDDDDDDDDKIWSPNLNWISSSF